jgi:Ca2+-binding RTX toxin-like protein
MNIDYIRAYAPGAVAASTGAATSSDSSGGASSTSSSTSSDATSSASTSSASTSTSASPGDVIWQNWAEVVDGYYAAPSGITDIVLSGWGQGIQGNNQGDTFYSSNAQNWLVGGTGNDTFYMGRGGDWATGGGGADIFKFSQLPWTGGHITDFNPSDVLDLSGMFASLNYWGSNPLADGHLAFVSDGAGGTQVWFDADGLSGVSGTWLVTTLDHVAPSTLSISNGLITEALSSSSSTSTGSGQTFWSDNNGDAWTGTSGNDTFNLGRGGDWVVGGGGNDTFKFAGVPWAAAHIMDFHSGDTIDLSGMFASVGYSTANPVADGRLWIGADGQGGTQIWFNAGGLANISGSWQLLDLAHVDPSSLHVNGAFITG